MNNRKTSRFISLAFVVGNLSACTWYDDHCADYPTELPDYRLPKMVVDSSYTYDIEGFLSQTKFAVADEINLIDSDSADKFEIDISYDMFTSKSTLNVFPRTIGKDFSFWVNVISHAGYGCEEHRATFRVVIPEIVARPTPSADSLETTDAE